MKVLAKALLWLSYIWFTGIGLLVLVSIVTMWLTEGFSAVQATFSPFNLWNTGTLLISIAPGLLLNWAAGKLDPTLKPPPRLYDAG